MIIFWTVFLAAVVGTTLMTLFSKICGRLFSKEFSEPKFLDAIFRPASTGTKKNNALGWVVHYLIGMLFAWAIYMGIQIFAATYSYWYGILLGGFLGLVGVLGWTVLLIFIKKPPQLEVPAFFIQLVFAHIVFGVGAILIFRNFENWF